MNLIVYILFFDFIWSVLLSRSNLLFDLNDNNELLAFKLLLSYALKVSCLFELNCLLLFSDG